MRSNHASVRLRFRVYTPTKIVDSSGRRAAVYRASRVAVRKVTATREAWCMVKDR